MIRKLLRNPRKYNSRNEKNKWTYGKSLRFILFLVGCVVAVIVLQTHFVRAFHFFRAIFRPLYDSYRLPPGINFTGKFQSCNEIGLFNATRKKKVFIGTLFNTEIELLMLQLDELSDIVDYFVVVESNMTFQQKPKELNLKNNLNLFKKYKNLVYGEASMSADFPGFSPFHFENLQRRQVADLVATLASPGDVTVVVDPDEILSVEAVKVLKNCEGFNSPLYLKTRTFVYSFEFEQNIPQNTGPIAHVYRGIPGKDGSRVFQNAVQYLDNSGWHCTFCFRYISQMIDKIQTYSHADRASKRHRNPTWVQSVACNGMDIFQFYPEVYTWKDVWKLITKNSNAITINRSLEGLPSSLRLYPGKYSFLLPGNCIRDDHPPLAKH